jgi:hypothetical protein
VSHRLTGRQINGGGGDSAQCQVSVGGCHGRRWWREALGVEGFRGGGGRPIVGGGAVRRCLDYGWMAVGGQS